MERQSQGGGHEGWRQAWGGGGMEAEAGVGEKRRETPCTWGGDRVGRAARRRPPAWKRHPLPPASHLWCLHAYSSSVPTRSSINTCRQTLDYKASVTPKLKKARLGDSADGSRARKGHTRAHPTT